MCSKYVSTFSKPVPFHGFRNQCDFSKQSAITVIFQWSQPAGDGVSCFSGRKDFASEWPDEKLTFEKAKIGILRLLPPLVGGPLLFPSMVALSDGRLAISFGETWRMMTLPGGSLFGSWCTRKW